MDKRFDYIGGDMYGVGVYQIANTIDSRLYIGSTQSNRGFVNRFREHHNSLSRGNHKNPHLQNFVNKYGIDSIVFSIVEYSDNGLDREQWYLDNYIEFGFDFNINLTSTAPHPIKFSKDECLNMVKEYLSGVSQMDLSLKYNVSPGLMSKILNGHYKSSRELSENKKKEILDYGQLKAAIKGGRSLRKASEREIGIIRYLHKKGIHGEIINNLFPHLSGDSLKHLKKECCKLYKEVLPTPNQDYLKKALYLTDNSLWGSRKITNTDCYKIKWLKDNGIRSKDIQSYFKLTKSIVSRAFKSNKSLPCPEIAKEIVKQYTI